MQQNMTNIHYIFVYSFKYIFVYSFLGNNHVQWPVEYLEYTQYTCTGQGKVKDPQIAFAAGGGEVCCKSLFPWEFICHFGSTLRELCLFHWHTCRCFTKAAAPARNILIWPFYMLSSQDTTSGLVLPLPFPHS